ncbi:hypothetical protein EJE24_07165 [Enterobacter huaxiensis]|uniref:Uncharacterized protein n=1 Tax=Enterobacter huaxiensis TaxID=2494702 RepID=A0A428LW65_9ENTR|nr:hypothetical protein EJE24_07165 [Enterobacter huaxiensis]
MPFKDSNNNDRQPSRLPVITSPERGDIHVCFCWPRVSCRKPSPRTNDLTLHLHQIHPWFYTSFL